MLRTQKIVEIDAQSMLTVISFPRASRQSTRKLSVKTMAQKRNTADRVFRCKDTSIQDNGIKLGSQKQVDWMAVVRAPSLLSGGLRLKNCDLSLKSVYTSTGITMHWWMGFDGTWVPLPNWRYDRNMEC